ncbi:MAG: type VI secretion system contractile sheath large subunit [Planctomycetota bacterium]
MVLSEEFRSSIAAAIARLDFLISRQIDEILHHPEFQEIEARCRAVDEFLGQLSRDKYSYETARLEDDSDQQPPLTIDHNTGLQFLEVYLLDITHEELSQDFDEGHRASELFRKAFRGAYDMPGGQPFGMFVVLFPFGPDDINTLRGLSSMGEETFAPVIADASPRMLGVKEFGELERMDFVAEGSLPTHVEWENFRALPRARFLGLTVPRILLRKPYESGSAAGEVPACPRCGRFLELGGYARGITRPKSCGTCENMGPTDEKAKRVGCSFLYNEGVTQSRDLLWGPSSLLFARTVMRSFLWTEWFVDIRGIPHDGQPFEIAAPRARGGLIDDQLCRFSASDSYGTVAIPSVDVCLTSEQEKHLSRSGFIPLVQCHGTNFLAYFSNESTHKIPEHQRGGDPQAERLSNMLQHVLCSSRFAHFLKRKANMLVGSQEIGTPDDLKKNLREWFKHYVNDQVAQSAAALAEKPLRNVRIEVKDDPTRPGAYHAVFYLQPQSHLDGLAAEVVLETRLSQ